MASTVHTRDDTLRIQIGCRYLRWGVLLIRRHCGASLFKHPTNIPSMKTENSPCVTGPKKISAGRLQTHFYGKSPPKLHLPRWRERPNVEVDHSFSPSVLTFSQESTQSFRADRRLVGKTPARHSDQEKSRFCILPWFKPPQAALADFGSSFLKRSEWCSKEDALRSLRLQGNVQCYMITW